MLLEEELFLLLAADVPALAASPPLGCLLFSLGDFEEHGWSETTRGSPLEDEEEAGDAETSSAAAALRLGVGLSAPPWCWTATAAAPFPAAPVCRSLPVAVDTGE